MSAIRSCSLLIERAFCVHVDVAVDESVTSSFESRVGDIRGSEWILVVLIDVFM